MKAFADLYTALDETTRTSEKLEALVRYFETAPPDDAAWVVYFLGGRRPRQPVPRNKVRAWAAEEAGVSEWLFGECYDAVGDMAETITLLLPDTGASSDPAGKSLRHWVEERLLPLRGASEEEQRAAVTGAWRELDRTQRFVWNKLLTGSFRVGVSQRLVTRALATVGGIEAAVVAHRLMGSWEPTPAFFEELLAKEAGGADVGRPYPFFLAHPLEGEPSGLGDPADWQAEWKWDGIRAQLIRRAGQTFLWSRGEELIGEGFPEVAAAGDALPGGTVLDGEVLPWSGGGVLPFSELQRRLGRKAPGRKILGEVPAVFLAYDLLELDGLDVRDRPLAWRRGQLERLIDGVAQPPLRVSPLAGSGSWDDLAAQRAACRDRGVEGLMLKRKDSPYRVGRVRGDWWKWKVDPFTVDAVLIYAQRGSGKRASLYTDYTFGVWDGGKLVPFAKAYSGLTDAEIRQVDAFVRRNTVEKFGPVRTVKPELVFELAFEGIQRSPRHKSGIAVRFPRIARWRKDKPIEEADSLDTVRSLLPAEGSST